MTQMIHFWVDPSNNIETNKRPPKMIHLSTPGANWNKNGTSPVAYLPTSPFKKELLLLLSF